MRFPTEILPSDLTSGQPNVVCLVVKYFTYVIQCVAFNSGKVGMDSLVALCAATIFK